MKKPVRLKEITEQMLIDKRPFAFTIGQWRGDPLLLNPFSYLWFVHDFEHLANKEKVRECARQLPLLALQLVPKMLDQDQYKYSITERSLTNEIRYQAREFSDFVKKIRKKD